jgi:hypothetical protein
MKLSRGYTYRLLKCLADLGLAAREMDGWVRGTRSLDEAAADLGTAGSIARQRKRHQMERFRYAQYLARTTGKVPDFLLQAARLPEGLVWTVDPDRRELCVVPDRPFFTDPRRVLVRREALRRLMWRRPSVRVGS